MRPAVKSGGFFSAPLDDADPAVFASIRRELERQQSQIELIASENIVSRAVLEAQGSVLTNKYAEGYPGRRYYGGCEDVDEAERLAHERAKQLFNCAFANVQPHSGAQANQAVFMALLQPGDTFLGMDLAAGGHLTHGSPANQSGKWFQPVAYTVKRDTCLIDYDQVAELAQREKPKLILAGRLGLQPPHRLRPLPRDRRQVGAWSHGRHGPLRRPGRRRASIPIPLPHAHVVTTTTHKTLRGPRGGMILANDEEIGKKINSAVFPGLQGGPLMHVIAAKAVAFGEALKPEFKLYAKAVRRQRAGAGRGAGAAGPHHRLRRHRQPRHAGRPAPQGRDRQGDRGGAGEDRHHLQQERRALRSDKPFTITSGVRLGSPAGTTRGFGVEEFRRIGHLIADVVDLLAEGEVKPRRGGRGARRRCWT